MQPTHLLWRTVPTPVNDSAPSLDWMHVEGSLGLILTLLDRRGSLQGRKIDLEICTPAIPLNRWKLIFTTIILLKNGFSFYPYRGMQEELGIVRDGDDRVLFLFGTHPNAVNTTNQWSLVRRNS